MMFNRLRAALGIMQYDSATGQSSVGGVDIPPAIPIAWADFILLDWTQLGGLFYLAIDAHSVGTTGGSLWRVDATGDRPILQDYSVNVATMALAISTYPPATWPGLRLHVVDWDIYIESNGTRYVPVGGFAYIQHEVFGTIASPTNSSASTGATYNFDATAAALAFPANMFSAGDGLKLESRGQKRGTAGTVAHKIILSATGANTDAAAWSATIANTDGNLFTAFVDIDITSATTFTTNSSNSLTAGASTTIFATATTNFNIANAMVLSYNGGKTAGDTVDLLKSSVKWVAK